MKLTKTRGGTQVVERVAVPVILISSVVLLLNDTDIKLYGNPIGVNMHK
jgi:hypothetical protein